MSEHAATIEWKRTSADFTHSSYNRDHLWRFEGGVTVQGTAAPSYGGDPALVDPEKAFVASLASCHMLTFLALCAKYKFVVDSYQDDAVGHLGKREDGRHAMVRVALRPKIAFASGAEPSQEKMDELHHKAHELCFIANSVTTEVTIE